MMEKVFICSPYSGTPKEMAENIKWAARLARYVSLSSEFCEDGFSVVFAFAPHLYLPQFLKDKDHRDTCIDISKSEISNSKSVVALAVAPTNGMQQEIGYASTAGVPVKFVTKEDIEEWEKRKYTTITAKVMGDTRMLPHAVLDDMQSIK